MHMDPLLLANASSKVCIEGIVQCTIIKWYFRIFTTSISVFASDAFDVSVILYTLRNACGGGDGEPNSRQKKSVDLHTILKQVKQCLEGFFGSAAAVYLYSYLEPIARVWIVYSISTLFAGDSPVVCLCIERVCYCDTINN